MKQYFYILSVTLVLLISCQTESNSQSDNAVKDFQPEIMVELTNEPQEQYSRSLKIFKYDSTYMDSTLVRQLWYYNNSLVKGEKFYYDLPFQSEYISQSIIDEAVKTGELEIFWEGVCEVGGTSAWNKYRIEYDDQNRPVNGEHYKAWWYEGLGDKPKPDKPEYFLSERINYSYGENWSKQKAFDYQDKLIEIIEKRFDLEGRLIYEHWEGWDTYRFKVFYNYY